MATKAKTLQFMQNQAYKPQTFADLAQALEVTDIEKFQKVVTKLEQDGDIILTRKQKYGLPEMMNLFMGRMQGHQKGFFFFIPDNPDQGDVFVGPANAMGAMHNDRVMVRKHPIQVGKKQEGEVVRVIEHANTRIVGTYEDNKNFGFVTPDEKRLTQDIFIPLGQNKKATNSDKVIVEITRWPEGRRNPEGKVVEIFGKVGTPGTDILSIIKKYNLPEDFPAKVKKEAIAVAKINPEDYNGRRDLRDMPMVTIDGDDARDLDDAVTIEVLDNGNYLLGVHIADVGNYVIEGGDLDKEALKRATSVYFVDRVIPMLPKELSNDICSLNAGVDRLAMTAMMEINQEGNVVNHEILQSVIKVDERMTYANVKKILVDNDADLIERYKSFVPVFKKMEKLCRILQEKRFRRGAIDFDFPESKVKLDEDGKVKEIVKVERSIADQMIEEFMICANETVAEHFFWLEAPFIYRVHEKPSSEKLLNLNEFLHLLGYHIKGNVEEIHPRAYQDIVEKVSGRPEEKVVSTILLRSMRHARYDIAPLGHFGLSSAYYSHFTSPIRRYPDLAIHRVIKKYLNEGNPQDRVRKKMLAKMEQYAVQSSEREKIAEEAERESVDLKKVEFMKRHLHEEFQGIISGVTQFGFFVELDNSVEGLVHVSTLTDDYYEFHEKQFMLLGKNTAKTFRIGDSVKIHVMRADVETRQIDFELAQVEKEINGAGNGFSKKRFKKA